MSGHGGSYMIAVAKHDWNSTGLWCFDPEIRGRVGIFITSVCASVSSGCSSARDRHQRRAAAPAPKDIWTSDALLLRYAKELDITTTTLNLAVA